MSKFVQIFESLLLTEFIMDPFETYIDETYIDETMDETDEARFYYLHCVIQLRANSSESLNHYSSLSLH